MMVVVAVMTIHVARYASARVLDMLIAMAGGDSGDSNHGSITMMMWTMLTMTFTVVIVLV